MHQDHKLTQLGARGPPFQVCQPRPQGEDRSGGGDPGKLSVRSQRCLLLAAFPSSPQEQVCLASPALSSLLSLMFRGGPRSIFISCQRVGNSYK